eukprot:scaffold2160_cov144-Isochrysis_galbana.AAC.4
MNTRARERPNVGECLVGRHVPGDGLGGMLHVRPRRCHRRTLPLAVRKRGRMRALMKTCLIFFPAFRSAPVCRLRLRRVSRVSVRVCSMCGCGVWGFGVLGAGCSVFLNDVNAETL